jgi:hypothetical protein
MRLSIYILAFSLIFFTSCDKEKDYELEIPDVDTTDNKIEYYNKLGPENYSGVPVSDVYEVYIKSVDKKQRLIVFSNACPQYEAGFMDMAENDKFPLDIFKNRTINWVNFSMSAEVEIEVKVISSKISTGSTTKVLPSRHGVNATTQGNTVWFKLTKPGQYSLEIGAEGYKNGLMLFANPTETDFPDFNSTGTIKLTNTKKGEIQGVGTNIRTISFEPGVHDIGVYLIPSNIKEIYLKDGAWVYGSFIMDGKSDVKIFGRGVLSSGRLKYRESHCIEAKNGSDRIHLEGIVVADPKYFAVRLIGRNNTVKWIKVIGGWVYNCDGIAAFEGSNVSNCFIWANDDAIKIYRNNITWSDCVVWQLNNGGVIQMSWGGSVASNVKVSRIDILRAEWNKPGFNRAVLNCVGNRYQTPGMYGIQKDWLIEDVVTETAVPVIFNITPDIFTQNHIHNLTLKNWNVKMTMNTEFQNAIVGHNPNTANGYVYDNIFRGFVFENFIFNNVKLDSLNWLQITKTKVENLQNPIFK